MRTDLRWPILGVLAAVAITSTMDATGLAVLSALPLAPLLAVFWYAQRLSRREVGFAWGCWGHYIVAILYPMTIAAVLILAAATAGVIDLSHTNWKKASINFALVALSTVLVVIITEEGFFSRMVWDRNEGGRVGRQERGFLWT